MHNNNSLWSLHLFLRPLWYLSTVFRTTEIGRFVAEFEEKYPKATETLTKDQAQLLTYFDYPAAHWVHLRTSNPVESPFATVKQQMKQTRGAGSRDAGLAMAFKPLLQAEEK